MAFSFGNVGNAMMAGSSSAGGVSTGPKLEVIQTEGIGFLALAGDAKVQLASKWSSLPSPTASLISIASRKGLVAAAGPDAIHIATTESVRKAFEAQKNGDSETRSFEPQVKVPLSIRISQLAFTADEKYLVLSAESGGGLAVYDVQSLSQGSSQPTFELGTSGESLRALIPNPMPDLAAFCALVTTNGILLMADLKERKISTLCTQASCATWSSKGKQLVAGLADGSIRQMTPDGAEKAQIPSPPGLGDYHVSSITWLENHVFLAVHTPTNVQEASKYHIITRSTGTPPSFVFQDLTDPVEPFTHDKTPHYSMLRLRDFPPNLQDLLIVSSTATDSLGLLSRSKTPLASDKPADKITNVFTTTELADDSRRAQVPMSEDLDETYPIGISLDLSGKDKVYKPIPTDEIEQSPGPLPAIWVLNNEGVLAAWWVVYNESIRSNTTYPGLTALEDNPAAQPSAPAASTTTAFGATASTPTAFGTPPALSTKPSAFGASPFSAATPPTAPAFGTPSFGSSAFGSKPSGAAPAFGQSTMLGMGMGMKTSPWAASSTTAAKPAFGQSSFGSATPGTGKVFGSATTSSPTASGGFASFANKGGFASLAGNSESPSVFGAPSKPPGSSFGTPGADISMDSDSAFLPPTSKTTSASPFGSSPFVLGTTFKADPTTANDNERPKESSGPFFDSGLALSLNDAAKQPPAPESKDEEMDAPAPSLIPEAKPKSIFESTTPTTTPAPQRFSFTTAGPSSSSSAIGLKPPSGGFAGLFGTPKNVTPEKETPKVKADEENKTKTPEAPLPPESTSKAAFLPGDSSSSSGTSRGSPETVAKTPTRVVEETPLAPDILGKKELLPKADDASTPPDFTPKPWAPAKGREDAPPAPNFLPTKPKDKSEKAPPVLEAAPVLPDLQPKVPSSQVQKVPSAPESPDSHEEGEVSEDEGAEDLGSEGSGVDVAKDLSPSTTGLGGQTPGFTPQSSFGGIGGSTFSSFTRHSPEQPRQLFGEINRNAPIFPRPEPASPRSPSPVRGAAVPPRLRPEASRSVSAPGMASQILGASRRPLQTRAMPAPAPAPSPAPAAAPVVSKMPVFDDPQDDAVQKILNEEIEPTLVMDEFQAIDTKLEKDKLMQSGEKTDEDVSQAVVLVYRDINRMLDTLAMNSRSLQRFILGHTERGKNSGRKMDDLEIPDDWVLCEIEDCGDILVHDMGQALEDGRVKDVEATLESIEALSRDLGKLRIKQEDMKRVIAVHLDADQVAITKSLPLSAEQTAQQNDLRRAYANFSKLLAEAEEELTVLKAKVAATGGATGKSTLPTVEAVMRTINKMTSMVEKRSGDVDVLENQMRKLRLGSSVSNAAGGSPRSREGSPLVSSTATPQRRSMMSLDGSNLRNSLASSVASYSGGRHATPPRKKVAWFSEEEKSLIRQKQAHRKGVLQRFRALMEINGPKVSRLNDNDA